MDHAQRGAPPPLPLSRGRGRAVELRIVEGAEGRAGKSQVAEVKAAKVTEAAILGSEEWRWFGGGHGRGLRVLRNGTRSGWVYRIGIRRLQRAAWMSRHGALGREDWAQSRGASPFDSGAQAVGQHDKAVWELGA